MQTFSAAMKGQHTADSGYMTSLSLVMHENFDTGNCTDRHCEKGKIKLYFHAILIQIGGLYNNFKAKEKYENYQFCKCTWLLCTT